MNISRSEQRRTVLRNQADGGTTIVSLLGSGQVAVYPAGAGESDVERIEVEGATGATTLSVRGPGSSVRGIVVNGSIGAIVSPDARLEGDLT